MKKRLTKKRLTKKRLTKKRDDGLMKSHEISSSIRGASLLASIGAGVWSSLLPSLYPPPLMICTTEYNVIRSFPGSPDNEPVTSTQKT